MPKFSSRPAERQVLLCVGQDEHHAADDQNRDQDQIRMFVHAPPFYRWKINLTAIMTTAQITADKRQPFKMPRQPDSESFISASQYLDNDWTKHYPGQPNHWDNEQSGQDDEYPYPQDKPFQSPAGRCFVGVPVAFGRINFANCGHTNPLGLILCQPDKPGSAALRCLRWKRRS